MLDEHVSLAALEAAREAIAAAPIDGGVLRMIVRRPAVDEREILDAGELDLQFGLRGDTWSQRPSSRTADGAPHPDMQLNVMSARVLDAVSGGRVERWPLAGDQLIVDLDLGPANLPAGTRLAIGEAVIEVTDQPHLGCAKFASRFGADALRFVNTGLGRLQRFRGLNARVVTPGVIRTGDVVFKSAAAG